MLNSEMWLVIKETAEDGFELVTIPLPTVSFISRVSCRDFIELKSGVEYELLHEKGEGIVYKGTFNQCFDYINKKENIK